MSGIENLELLLQCLEEYQAAVDVAVRLAGLNYDEVMEAIEAALLGGWTSSTVH